MNEPRFLDPKIDPKVSYCIETWLRDEQIRLNTAAVKGRIEPHDKRQESVALACFGPSLNETWERLKEFPYVISCSGAHKFLVERGLIPTWHVEVDPRPHKIQLIGEPQHGTEYLISSTCHPQVLKHLDGFNVKLWHVFDATEDGQRLLPPGEWAITGGCDVGLRALTIAGFLGFRDVHVFGMDQSAGTVDRPASARHAADHPNSGKKFAHCEYDGVVYLSTPAMLEAARGVWHELDQMPKLKATFYGEGLCQHMARHYTPRPVDDVRLFANTVAIEKPELISAEYCRLNVQLHRDNLAYGVGGGKHADTVLKLAETLRKSTPFVSILDYGCGKGYLGKALPFPIAEYDPAITGKQESPRPADLVIATDVLEHIEPDHLRYVLKDLQRCIRQIGFFTIATGPAKKTLADGRNTHLIQKDLKWWRTQLQKYFTVARIWKLGGELYVLVGPRPKGEVHARYARTNESEERHQPVAG